VTPAASGGSFGWTGRFFGLSLDMSISSLSTVEVKRWIPFRLQYSHAQAAELLHGGHHCFASTVGDRLPSKVETVSSLYVNHVSKRVNSFS
jgi:hypothetical protein